MPALLGLTREEEQDIEDHAKDQLLGLLDHKQEYRFFSREFIELINPKFKAKRDKDPEWHPGLEKQIKRPKLGAAKLPSPQRAPPSASPLPPSSPVEEELSTDLGDFASFFQGK